MMLLVEPGGLICLCTDGHPGAEQPSSDGVVLLVTLDDERALVRDEVIRTEYARDSTEEFRFAFAAVTVIDEEC